MLSLVTVSPVITAFHSCCLSHHVFDQVNLWPAWVGIETAIFWQCSPGTVETQRLYPLRHGPRKKKKKKLQRWGQISAIKKLIPNHCELFDAKSILVEEQLSNPNLEDKGVHAFPKGIGLKVNEIAKLGFELAYSRVHHDCHYATKAPSLNFLLSYTDLPNYRARESCLRDYLIIARKKTIGSYLSQGH